MHSYQVSAVGDDGVTMLATTDTATQALEKFKAAIKDYRRAWVTDDTGADVSMKELIVSALREQGTNARRS